MSKVILFFVLIIVLFSCEKKENPLIGQTAYDFVLNDVADQSKKLSDFKNQKIMLHFWADWCASCGEEFFYASKYF